MRCYDKDETKPCSSSVNYWTSNINNHGVLETMRNIHSFESKTYSNQLPSLYTLDSVSQTSKRKILDCEKEDLEERFIKVQRKQPILETMRNSDLVINDSDEANEQMEWFKGDDAMSVQLQKNNKDVDLSVQNMNSSTPIVYVPKFTWREEQHLLHISMAKICGVDDPETYLRRSVLINNTVKRLQKDVAINNKCQSHFQENGSCHISSNWVDANPSDGAVACKQSYYEANNFQDTKHNGYSDFQNNFSYHNIHSSVPYDFHLSVYTQSPDESASSLQCDILQNSSFSKILYTDQSIDDPLSCQTFKQGNSVHMYSSQPCGLQYRNPVLEDSDCDYSVSCGSSSILDSVVYHSLIASLET